MATQLLQLGNSTKDPVHGHDRDHLRDLIKLAASAPQGESKWAMKSAFTLLTEGMY
jgi:hypothetical protein